MKFDESNQSEEKRKKIKKVYDYFNSHGGNIKEISKELNIPESSVQRYINSVEFLEFAKTQAIEDKINEPKTLEPKKGAVITEDIIKQYLQDMKNEGLKKGGTNTQEKYGFEKDDEGKFQGSRKK